jgi:hypothetical protein
MLQLLSTRKRKISLKSEGAFRAMQPEQADVRRTLINGRTQHAYSQYTRRRLNPKRAEDSSMNC